MILMLSRTGLGNWAHMNLVEKGDSRGQGGREKESKREKIQSVGHRGREGG